MTSTLNCDDCALTLQQTCFCATSNPRITHDATPTESSLDCGTVVPVVFTFCSKARCRCMEVTRLTEWTLRQHWNICQRIKIPTFPPRLATWINQSTVQKSISGQTAPMEPSFCWQNDGILQWLPSLWKQTKKNMPSRWYLPNTVGLFVRLNPWFCGTSWWWFEHHRRWPSFANGMLSSCQKNTNQRSHAIVFKNCHVIFETKKYKKK